jgi:hypothetical protein
VLSGGFANYLTTSFHVPCSIVSCEGAAELVNNIPYLLCDPLTQTHDAKKVLIGGGDCNTFVLLQTCHRFPQTFALL